MPAAMSAANEVAVAAFLERQIGFMDIPRTIAATMEAHETRPASSLEAVMEANAWARSHSRSRIQHRHLAPAPSGAICL